MDTNFPRWAEYRSHARSGLRRSWPPCDFPSSAKRYSYPAFTQGIQRHPEASTGSERSFYGRPSDHQEENATPAWEQRKQAEIAMSSACTMYYTFWKTEAGLVVVNCP